MPKAAYIGPTWFLHQTAHDERGWASDVRHCHTQRARTFHWPALCLWWRRLRVHRLGDFSLSRSPEEVRKSTREREIHHYLSVLCACGCDCSCFRPTSRTLWRLFQKTGFVSILRLCDHHFDFIVRHHFCTDGHGFVGWLDRGLIDICEKSLEMCICLWPEFDRLSWGDPVWLRGLDIKIQLLLLLY